MRVEWFENPDNVAYVNIDDFADNRHLRTSGKNRGIPAESNCRRGGSHRKETIRSEAVYSGSGIQQTHRYGGNRLGIYR